MKFSPAIYGRVIPMIKMLIVLLTNQKDYGYFYLQR